MIKTALTDTVYTLIYAYYINVNFDINNLHLISETIKKCHMNNILSYYIPYCLLITFSTNIRFYLFLIGDGMKDFGFNFYLIFNLIFDH